MSDIPYIIKKYLFEKCEKLYILGIYRPYQVKKLLGVIDIRTAKKHMDIGREMAQRNNKEVVKTQFFQQELNRLNQLISKAKRRHSEAKNINERIRALSIIEKLARERKELLDF